MNFGWKSVNGVLLLNKYLQILLTQYVPRCSCKTGCAKICGYDLSIVLNIANVKGVIINKNIWRHTVQNVSFKNCFNEYFHVLYYLF